MAKQVGKQTYFFDHPPIITGYAAVGSTYEEKGRFGNQFDYIFEDPMAGAKSWEQAESELQKTALRIAMQKAGRKPSEIRTLFAGDLLNQCIGSTFGTKGYGIPFVGVYGACSTMALSTMMASFFVDGGLADHAAAVTSSHFCSAERQYRFPLEYGGQRPPTAQWTATASGALILSKAGSGVTVTRATIGRVTDLGVTDSNNMGAAMAPAACDTILQFLKDTGTKPDDYNCIFTGDLGQVGTDLLYELAEKEGVTLRGHHDDCGLLLYDQTKQDVHAGGSGCGCSAAVLCTHILNTFRSGEYRRVLFCATGALLSPTSVMQGEIIPSIAHLIEFSV